MSAFRFHDPLWLLLLLPVLWVTWQSRKQFNKASIQFSNVEHLRNIPRSWAQRLKPFVNWLWPLAMISLIVSLARPQLGHEEIRLNTEGIAIMMCIDRSGSMNAMDFEFEGKRVNRLEVVKRVFRDFVLGKAGFSGRPDDLIGLVAFGGFAESKCPPTLDHDTLVKILDTVKIPEPVFDSRGRIINESLLNEEQATAIGDALGSAVDRLKDLKIKSKIIVLLSDGESNAGVLTPEEGTEAAKAFGIKIYSIGVGTNGLAPFVFTDRDGQQFLRNQMVKLDEAALKKIATSTGGSYFNAADTESLKQVYEAIDQLEKTETEGKVYTDYRDLFQYFVLPGAILILLELFLLATRFLSIP
ncbi:MAG: VWA domain-containing protein [Pirellulales bacterium]